MSRGPIPKEDAARRPSHPAALPTVELGDVPVEGAPKISDRQLRKLALSTRKWWKTIIAAPQASQFGATDWNRLEMIVLPLVERFNREEAKGADADEGKLVRLGEAIAKHEKEFGLTPESRLRLRWALRPKVAAGSSDDEAKKPTTKPRETKRDPRRELELVKGGKR